MKKVSRYITLIFLTTLIFSASVSAKAETDSTSPKENKPSLPTLIFKTEAEAGGKKPHSVLLGTLPQRSQFIITGNIPEKAGEAKEKLYAYVLFRRKHPIYKCPNAPIYSSKDNSKHYMMENCPRSEPNVHFIGGANRWGCKRSLKKVNPKQKFTIYMSRLKYPISEYCTVIFFGSGGTSIEKINSEDKKKLQSAPQLQFYFMKEQQGKSSVYQSTPKETSNKKYYNPSAIVTLPDKKETFISYFFSTDIGFAGTFLPIEKNEQLDLTFRGFISLSLHFYPFRAVDPFVPLSIDGDIERRFSLFVGFNLTQFEDQSLGVYGLIGDRALLFGFGIRLHDFMRVSAGMAFYFNGSRDTPHESFRVLPFISLGIDINILAPLEAGLKRFASIK